MQGLKIVAGRVVHAVFVLFLVTLATTAMIDLTPGNAAAEILGQQATAAQIRAVDRQLGLDQPVIVQYFHWVRNALTGNLGQSPITHQRVASAIGQALPVTLEITILALIMAVLIAIPWGIYSAYRVDGAFDRLSGVGASILISSPAFLTGLFLAFIFAIKIHVFPVTGWVTLTSNPLQNLRYAFLPAFTLCLAVVAIFARILRGDMVTTLHQEFILAAHAKGLPVRRVLFRHALRPSLFSFVTLLGLSLGQLIGGAVIVESLFSLPGIGSTLILSIEGKDLVMVQGIVAVIAVAYIVINILVDIAYVYLDPRVSFVESAAV
jgi:peptide/nickel transport system permease protein